MTIALIQVDAAWRGITRLCHFTPSRNLGHIAVDPIGVLASKHLRGDEKTIFNPTDQKRLDGHPDHVCCSIQYPNAWYFEKARARELVFRDWVVLLLEAHYLWGVGTKFCPRNAAAKSGCLIGEGVEAFKALFAQTVEGYQGALRRRSPRHHAFLPTDEQAEVLIPDRIERQDVIGVAVQDDAQARREVTRLKHLGKIPPRIVIVPQFFDPHELNALLRAGEIPFEREHLQGAKNV